MWSEKFVENSKSPSKSFRMKSFGIPKAPFGIPNTCWMKICRMTRNPNTFRILPSHSEYFQVISKLKLLLTWKFYARVYSWNIAECDVKPQSTHTYIAGLCWYLYSRWLVHSEYFYVYSTWFELSVSPTSMYIKKKQAKRKKEIDFLLMNNFGSNNQCIFVLSCLSVVKYLCYSFQP